MATANFLPPIIADWIEKINDQKTPIHVRENYAQMLQVVAQQATATVVKFNAEKIKNSRR